MQSIEPKVMAAISAAVAAYLQEEAAALAALEAPASAAPFAQINLWAITGRQEAMAMRRAWQMRLC